MTLTFTETLLAACILGLAGLAWNLKDTDKPEPVSVTINMATVCDIAMTGNEKYIIRCVHVTEEMPNGTAAATAEAEEPTTTEYEKL